MADNKEARNENNVINVVLPEDDAIVRLIVPANDVVCDDDVLLDACTPVLFSPPPSEWGDSVAPNDALSFSPEKPHEERSEVPKVLSD